VLYGHQIHVTLFGMIKLMIGRATPLLTCQRKRLETKRALIRHEENLQGKSEEAKVRNRGKSKEGALRLQLLENPHKRQLH